MHTMAMRRIIPFILILGTLVLAFSLFINPLVVLIVKSQVQKALPGSQVSIRKCSLRPIGHIGFWQVQVRQPKSVDLSIQEVHVSYDWASIRAGSLGGMSVKGLNFKGKVGDQDAIVSDGTVNISMDGPGSFDIARIKINKLKMEFIQGSIKRESHAWRIDPLTARMLNGDVRGTVTLDVKEQLCLAQVRFKGLDMAKVVRDFELKEKVEMTGLADGPIILQIKGSQIQILKGSLAISKGGILIMKDVRFLKDMAKRAGLPDDIFVDSFQDYHYNMGIIQLFLKAQDLTMNITLDGETGKRDIPITLHGFTLTKDGL
jgi:hypothetical protein